MLCLVLEFVILVIIIAYAVNLRIYVEMFTENSETPNLVCTGIHDYLTCHFANLSFLLSIHTEF